MEAVAVHTFKDLDSLGFNTESYSKFKYGCFFHTIEFAQDLSVHVTDHLKRKYPDGVYPEIMVAGAPYNQVPVASTALAEYTAAFVANILPDANIKTFKISRNHSYHDDYGDMDAAMRDKSISGETFYVEAKSVKDKLIIFVDDIRITGSHERRIVKMVQKLKIKSEYFFAYYALLDNDQTPPKIEGQLNNAYLGKQGENVINFIERANVFQEPLILNTRVTKYLLTLDSKLFHRVCIEANNSTLWNLYKYALGNSYATHELYQHNFVTLQRYLHS